MEGDVTALRDPQVVVRCTATSHVKPTVVASYYRTETKDGPLWDWDDGRAMSGGAYLPDEHRRERRQGDPKHTVRWKTSDDLLCPKCGDRKLAKSVNVDAALESLYQAGVSAITLAGLRAILP